MSHTHDQPMPAAPRPEALYQGERGRAYFERVDVTSRHVDWNMWLWNDAVDPDDVLVEFGCGAGRLLSRLRARRKLGVEINPAAVAEARAQGLDVRTSLAELPAASFTKAISSHALEHVASPHETLRDLHRVLRPGGSLVLLLPMDDWRESRQRRFAPGDPDMHLHCWTPLTLGNLLVTAGYHPTDVRVVAHSFPPRGGELLWRLGQPIFHAAATASAVLLRKRQLFARATAVPSTPERS